MVFERIQAMMQSCSTESSLFPPTLLYNEGWLLRLAVDWFSWHEVPNYPLSFYENSRWFSEALLPSAFLARQRGDPLAESWTHADGVIGHLLIGAGGKADVSLLQDATHFVVLEAKMLSRLSPGVKNAAYFDQAARIVACMAEALHRADRSPPSITHLGFFVLAPHSRIVQGIFAGEMDRASICEKVGTRVQQYGGAKDQWYSEWFDPAFQKMDLATLSWEELITVIGDHDASYASSMREFYAQCVEFNR